MLVDALRRGYEDFRVSASPTANTDPQFLHGPLQDLLSSPSFTSTLDRFWTHFALQFESTFVTPQSDSTGLSTWLGGFAAPSVEVQAAVDRSLQVFGEDTELENVAVGIIGKNGPLSTPTSDFALTRYLVGLVRDSLPPPPPIRTLPKVQEPRKSSWSGWVPDVSSLSLRSSTLPSATTVAAPPRGREGKRSRWTGLGLGGLGESLGSVGQALSLGSNKTTIKPAISTSVLTSEGDAASIVSKPEVQQSDIVLPDLQDAQVEPELDLAWNERSVWLADGVDYVEKRLISIIVSCRVISVDGR